MELATYYKQDAVLKSTYETSPFIFFFSPENEILPQHYKLEFVLMTFAWRGS